MAILLHGFPELPCSWSEQFAALSDRFTVVAPQLRGYPPSYSPSSVSEYTLPILRQDLLELVEQNRWGPIHLVGHDWGGAIAWEAAMHMDPSLLRSVSVLNSSPPALLLKRAIRSRQIFRSWYMFLFQLPKFPEWMLRRMTSEQHRRVFVNAAKNDAPFDIEGLQPYHALVQSPAFRGLHYYRAAMRKPDFGLTNAAVPAQLIWGTDDPALGIHLTEESLYSNWVENMTIHRIPGAGHWVQQEASDRVNVILREFWSANA